MHHAGLPKSGRGKWPLFECFDWYVKNILDYDRDSKESGELTKIKTDLYTLRTEKEAFELAIKRKKYFPIETISEAWAARARIVKTGLRNFANRLAPVLTGKDRDEIRKILKDETNQLLADYCMVGAHTPQNGEIKGWLKDLQQRFPKRKYVNREIIKNGKKRGRKRKKSVARSRKTDVEAG